MSTTTGSNIQWPSGSAYQNADRGTGAYGVKEIQSAIAPVSLQTIDFETDPIPGAGGGDLPWLTTVSSPHTGTRCFRSGAITNSQQSLWTFSNPVGAINLVGWYRVSSEAGFDFLEIYKDSVSVPNRVLQQSGTANVWTQFTVNVAGATNIIFRYVKDSSASSGLDTVFIDDLDWQTASQPAINNWEPFHLNNNNQVKVTMLGDTLAVTGTVTVLNPAPTVSGALNIRPLSCATDSIEICNDVGNPIPVSGTITVNQGTSPWVVGGTVNIGTIPEVEIKNDSGNPIPVSFTRLNCNTDSVEICNDAGSPITVSGTVNIGNIPHVVVDNFPAVAHLNCATDSVEICNDAGSPITVSGTVNIGNVPHVIVDSLPEVEIKNDTGNPIPVSFTRLTCGTDSVEICNDVGNPITVNVTNTPHVIVDLLPAVTITGNVTVSDVYTPQAVFYSTFGENAFNTAADSATGGRLWLLNTTSQLVIVREVRFTCVVTSLVDLGSALPLLQMERITFTGAPSGATITPCKRDSTDPSNVGTLRTANTGMTITTGAVARKFAPPNLSVIGGLLSANTALSTPTEQIFQPQDRRLLVLRQNEGIVFRQSTAGNATEGRSFMINIMWEELP